MIEGAKADLATILAALAADAEDEATLQLLAVTHEEDDEGPIDLIGGDALFFSEITGSGVACARAIPSCRDQHSNLGNGSAPS